VGEITYLEVAIEYNVYKTIQNIDVCIESELSEVKVPINFLGVVGSRYTGTDIIPYLFSTQNVGSAVENMGSTTATSDITALYAHWDNHVILIVP
jgi:hypothetical protein